MPLFDKIKNKVDRVTGFDKIPKGFRILPRKVCPTCDAVYDSIEHYVETVKMKNNPMAIQISINEINRKGLKPLYDEHTPETLLIHEKFVKP